MLLLQFRVPRASTSLGISVASLILLAGCVSSPEEPQETIRSNLQTAPADLQLLCASAAANSVEVESARVLPVGSQQLDAGNYQVDLDAGGSRMSCIIDGEGNVRSIQPSQGGGAEQA